MLQWIQSHESLLWWLAGASVVMLVGSVLLLPVLVVRMPADYFHHRRRHGWLARRHPAVRIGLLIVKNIVGAVLLLAGAAMLVLPGQGILCMLIGLTLMDYPGKFRLERWIIGRKAVRNTINWMRRRAGRAPLRPFEDDPPATVATRDTPRDTTRDTPREPDPRSDASNARSV